jgi:hypothetical protein
MFVRAAVVWVAGLLTIVPFATYELFFHAPRDQYAQLIGLVLFWVFGYWGVVGPLLAAIRVRRVFRALEQAASRDDLMKALGSDEAREAAIDLIASENRLPRFLAARVYRMLVRRLWSAEALAGRSSELPGA